MKRNVLKILSLVITLSFITGLLLTGCANNQAGSAGATASTESIATTAEASTAPQVTDMNGAEIKIAAWWDGTPGAMTREKDRQVTMEKKYNCKITWLNIAAEEYKNKLTTTALSGDPAADIYMIRSNWTKELMRKGYLLPLDDILNLGDPIFLKVGSEYCQKDGKTFGVILKSFAARGVVFNKTLFQKDSQPNPYDLVKNNEWNWSKLEEIAKATTKDMNGDGKPDEFGIQGMDANILIGLIYSNNAKLFIDKDGTTVPNFDDPNAIEAMEYAVKLQNEDKVIGGGDFSEGKTAMAFTDIWTSSTYKEKLADTYGWLWVPMGPKATDYVNCSDEVIVYGMPASAKNAKNAAIILSEFFQPYPSDRGNIDTFEPMMSDPDGLQIAVDATAKTIVCDWCTWDNVANVIVPGMFKDMLDKKATVQQAVTSYTPKMQADIDTAAKN